MTVIMMIARKVDKWMINAWVMLFVLALMLLVMSGRVLAMMVMCNRPEHDDTAGAEVSVMD